MNLGSLGVGFKLFGLLQKFGQREAGSITAVEAKEVLTAFGFESDDQTVSGALELLQSVDPHEKINDLLGNGKGEAIFAQLKSRIAQPAVLRCSECDDLIAGDHEACPFCGASVPRSLA